jgi:1-acyl-sn-glycerol-3-phosphate acyltransferase
VLWYRFTRLTCRTVLRLLYRFRTYGIENIPVDGGVVIASNHASYLDPVLLGSANTVRRVYFMAKEELFRVPVFGKMILSLGAMPIRRGGFDRNIFRTFGDMLKVQKLALVVFPEGTRSRDGKLGPARRGVGALCLAAGVPVVPAHIRGSFEAWPRFRLFPRLRGEIEVRFGSPIQWSDGELKASDDPNESMADLILKKIEELSMTEGKALGFRETNRTTTGKDERTAQDPRHEAGPQSNASGKE